MHWGTWEQQVLHSSKKPRKQTLVPTPGDDAPILPEAHPMPGAGRRGSRPASLTGDQSQELEQVPGSSLLCAQHTASFSVSSRCLQYPMFVLPSLARLWLVYFRTPWLTAMCHKWLWNPPAYSNPCFHRLSKNTQIPETSRFLLFFEFFYIVTMLFL